MSYQGDYAEDYADLNFKFTTRDTDSAPFTLGGTPALSVYKSNGATQTTAGITLTADFDSVTGLNHVKIDLSADAFYATGEDYQVVITTGTVNGNSVVGEVVGTFSIENRFMRGTDSAALASNYTAARAGYLDNINGHTAQTGDNYARLGAPAGASVSADVAAVKTDTGSLVTRITSTLFTGITSLAEWIGAIAGKQAADATAQTEIRATGAGSGTFDATTDSQEALRDNQGTAQTGDAFAYLGTNLGALGANATEAGGTGDHLTAIPWNAAWDAEVQSEVNDGLVSFWTSPATLVDLVWDEVLTGATHNVNNSSGKRLRQVDAGFEVHSGTAQAGSTANTFVMDTGADGTNDNIYRGDRIVISGGTGQGEHGIIISYTASTRTATMSENWVVTPDATSEFIVVPADVDLETWNHSVVTGDGDWAALKAETAAILLDTAEIGAAGAGLTEAGGTGDHLTAIDLPNQTMDITGNLSGSVGSVTGAVGSVTGAVGSVTGSVGSVVGHTPQTGDTYALASGATGFTAIDTVVDGIQTDLDNATDGLGALKTLIDAVQTAVDALNDPSVSDIWTTALTEAYRGTGATGTGSQLLYEVIAHLGESSISGTTKTIKKLDGSTTAKTYTLDDATNPTSVTEAT